MQNDNIHICEVGLRDGFQFISDWIPTKVKLDLARSILLTGIDEVQLTSFVRRDLVPQMSDAADIVAAYNEFGKGFDWTRAHVLVLNKKGLELASAAGARAVEISISSNEIHGQRNARRSVEEGLKDALDIIDSCKELGIRVRAGIQCVFGYEQPGDTSNENLERIVRALAERTPSLISVADTTGMANPESIKRVVELCKTLIGEVPLGCHLHDTRGLGILNAHTAYLEGVRHFDSSLAGMGGCPFVVGAAGNIATEDLLYLLEQSKVMTYATHRDVASLAIKVEDQLGKRFPGKMHQVERITGGANVG